MHPSLEFQVHSKLKTCNFESFLLFKSLNFKFISYPQRNTVVFGFYFVVVVVFGGKKNQLGYMLVYIVVRY